jgi:hypothetical protein
MSTGSGVLAKCGISTPATWGAVWAAVSVPLPFDSESIDQAIEQLEDQALEGVAGQRAPEQGLIKIAGALIGDMDYYNWGSMLKAAFGAEASSGVFTFADDLAEIRRIEFEKSVSRWRIDSFMVEQCIISGEKGKALKIQFDLAGRMQARSSDAFPSISLTNRARILFSNSSTNSRIRIADQVDALASGDAVGWESFKFTIKNNLKADDATNQQRYALQPVRNGFREVSLEFKDPRYTAETYRAWAEAGTLLQADLYFTNGTKTFLLELPELKFKSGLNNNVSGPGVIVQEATFGAYRNLNNTPMAAITNEARITIA